MNWFLPNDTHFDIEIHLVISQFHVCLHYALAMGSRHFRSKIVKGQIQNILLLTPVAPFTNMD